MRIYEITERTPECLAALLAVWERSVRATHTFLSESEILRIRGYVPQALAAVPELAVLEDGHLLGFLGAGEGRLEMLFLDPDARGRGLGRALLTYGLEHYAIREVTVNEQNPGALGFYRHFGFREYRRTEEDEEGGPYPLLYLRREGCVGDNRKERTERDKLCAIIRGGQGWHPGDVPDGHGDRAGTL